MPPGGQRRLHADRAYAEELDGVTEVRAGVFVFFDLVMAGIGVCASKTSRSPCSPPSSATSADKGWILIDAGWMAMSRDRGTAKQPVDQGYGLVCDLDGRPIPDLIVVDTNQEHGVIAQRRDRRARCRDLPVGTRLRILPEPRLRDRRAARPLQGRRAEGWRATWPRFSGW